MNEQADLQLCVNVPMSEQHTNEACVEALKSKKGIEKYTGTIALIEDELYSTLAYLNQQIALADEQSSRIDNFSKSVYEAKKMLVEQKIQLLKHLSSLAVDQIKISNKKEDDIQDITSLFSK